MPDSVRSPRLLDANLQEARRLRPTALSLSLNRRSVSTAQITLPGEDEALPLMGFVELYLCRGGAGIFRVKETSQAAKGGNTRTYALSHAVSTLHDSVWRAQEDFSGTVTAFLTQLLGYQQTARWQLGTVQDTSQWKKSGINYDHLDTLLYELAADRKDYLLTFDFSTSPWTLNFVQASGQVDCEMRRTRNLSDAQARGSLEGMCNRLYLTVHSTAQSQEDATVTEPTTQLYTYNDTASQAEFGIIEDTADIDTADVPDVAAWVAAFFQEHAAPQRQTSADGYEVVKSTGEPFDQFDLGKRCRIPALQVEGPVESIRFDNLLSDPDKARLDLNQKQQSATGRLHSLKEQARAAAASVRSAGYAAKKNAADVEKHYNHVVNVTDQGMEDCFGVIGVKLDAQHKPIKDAQGNYVWAGPGDSPAEIWNHLHRNAWSNQILNHIKDANGNIISLAEVYTDAYGNALINAINDQRTGTATINADRININTTQGSAIKLSDRIDITTDNYLRLNGTVIVNGALDVFGNYSVSARNFVVGTGGYIRLIGAQSGEYYDITASNMPGTITALQFVEDQNNAGRYILQKKTLFSSASWTNEANFNIAATQFYRDALAAGRIISANDNIVSGTLTVSSGNPVTLYPGHVIGGVVTKISDYALTVSAADSAGYTRYFANASLNPITSLTIPAGESRQIHIAYDDGDGIQILEDSMTVTAESEGGGGGGGGGGTTHDIQCSSTVASIGTDRGNRTNAGAISKQNLQAYSYLGFTISCSGETKSFYITVNP